MSSGSMPYWRYAACCARISSESADVEDTSFMPPLITTSMSPKPRLARCAFSFATVSSGVMSGTSRMSSFATMRCGRIVLPPGPV